MSIKFSAVENELTERKLTSPFISEKKIKGHEDGVTDFATVTYPDGQDRIITSSFDPTLRIFNLEEEKTEGIINHSTAIYSVHFYKEEKVLMTTDWRGRLIIWELFPKVRKIRRIQVTGEVTEYTGCCLSNLTQTSSNNFFSCVSFGNSNHGCLYRINFNKNKNSWTSKEINYPTPNNDRKSDLNSIYQLINQKNIILFAGRECTIKSFDLNLNNSNRFQRFPEKHQSVINCLTSFINSKYEEIILSGSRDKKIIFWNMKREYLKEIQIESHVNCFLNGFSRDFVFVACVNIDDHPIYSNLISLSTVTETLEENQKIKNIHETTVFSLNWIDKEKQNKMISCSSDKTFNIYEMEEYYSRDVDETFDFLRKMSDCKIKFKNKKIKFWNTFMNEISEKHEKEETLLRKFEQMETNIEERTIFSMILGKYVKIPFGHLPDYYYFFKKLNLKHCMASINRKIKKIKEFKDMFYLFKDFCMKYENEKTKNWFSTNTNTQELEDFQPNTSFALSLFNKLRNNDEIEFLKFEQDEYSPKIFKQIRKSKSDDIIEPINHKDFEGVNDMNELKPEFYFKKLYENRSSNFNLTLISTDKKEFQVHKEILILQYEFFILLFRFRGSEVTEYEETGKITLVDLMSSDVVEILIKYAYFGTVEIKNEGIQTLETIIKLFIFCDQFNEQALMNLANSELQSFFKDLKSSTSQKKEEELNKTKEEVLKIFSNLSSYLGGSDRILGILKPKLIDFGFGFNDCLSGFLMQISRVKDELVERDKSEKKLKERILELEKLVGEINEDDEGIGKGQIRDRENDEDDEEIKKEQPKRKKRKINILK